MQRVTKTVATDSVTQFLRETQKSYDALGNVTESIDPRGLITKYTYNPLGQIVSTETYSASQRLSENQMDYDVFGNIIKTTDERGNNTEFTYDKNSNLLTQKNVYGQITNYTYDKLNRLISLLEPFGKKTVNEYDDNGNIKKAMIYKGNDLAETVSFTYDKLGNIISADNSEAVVSFEYDNLANKTKETIAFDNTSESTSYTYFPNSLIKTVIAPDTGKTQFEYDGLGNPIKTILSNDSYYKVEYGVWGAVSNTDRMNRTEYFEYNGFGKQSLTTRADGSTVQYGYDAVGDLISLADENGNKTEWQYNILGLPVIKKYADGSTYKYTYNEFGQPVSRTDAMNRVTEFVYDSYGNISGINYPNDPDISFSYDSYGHVNSMSDASGVSEFTYDISGNIESVNGPFDDDSITYEYDNKNRRTAMILNGSKIESYTYDPVDRISSITVYNGDESHTFEFNYHKLTNSYLSVSLDGKVITGNQYDGLGRLINKTNKSDNDSVISKLDYTLNNADLRTKISSTNETNSTKEFSYNLVNELTGAKKYTEENSIKIYDNNYKFSFDYDPVGNRLSSYFPDIPLSYQPNELNQYTSIFNPDGSASTPLYNANGCMNKYGSALYEYNDENRLSTVVEGVSPLTPFGETKIENIYDGLGRRRLKKVYSFSDNQWNLQTETQFTYDGFKLIQETELNSNLEILNSKFYYWNNDTLLAVYQDNQFYFPQTDGNKNITSYTDSEGNIVAEYEYSPFGQIVNSEGEMADDFSFRFSSEYYDQDLDLYAYIFRYYSPVLGRWLSRDPLGEEAGINLYCMVNNDTINNWDLLGLRVWDDHIANLITTVTYQDYQAIMEYQYECQCDENDGKLKWKLLNKKRLKDELVQEKILVQKAKITVERHSTDWLTEPISQLNNLLIQLIVPSNAISVPYNLKLNKFFRGGKFDNEWSYTNPGETLWGGAPFEELEPIDYTSKYNFDYKHYEGTICTKKGDNLTTFRNYNPKKYDKRKVEYERVNLKKRMKLTG